MMTTNEMTRLRDLHVPRPPEFHAVMPGDIILAPCWPVPVTVEAAVPQDARFVLVHWSAPGISGVSSLSGHALVTIVQAWDPGKCGRYVPREVPAASALSDTLRAQYLAGITWRRDNAALVAKWAVESDMVAMSRGEYRTQQPCGCCR
jgi:hypothetical protein